MLQGAIVVLRSSDVQRQIALQAALPVDLSDRVANVIVDRVGLVARGEGFHAEVVSRRWRRRR